MWSVLLEGHEALGTPQILLSLQTAQGPLCQTQGHLRE